MGHGSLLVGLWGAFLGVGREGGTAWICLRAWPLVSRGVHRGYCLRVGLRDARAVCGSALDGSSRCVSLCVSVSGSPLSLRLRRGDPVRW